MKTQQPRHHDKLDALAQQFAQWRQTRPSLKVKIPEVLLDQALELSRSHPSKSAVLKKLRINHSQLKRHQQTRVSGTAVVQPTPVDFVQLPAQLPSLMTTLATNTPTVHLTRQDGHKMTISDLDMAQLSQRVNGFMASAVQEVSPCCS